MIADFLKEALQERANVQVPGLGTFTTQPLSAAIDEDVNVINPPSAEIVFIDDENYGDVDDSIITYIATKTDKTLEEIESEVAHIGNQVNAQVNASGSYVLDSIGTFEKGVYGQLTFKSNPESLSASSYGLPKLAIEPLPDTAIVGDNTDDANDDGGKSSEATLWGILIPSILIVAVAIWLMIDEGARDKATTLIGMDNTEQTDSKNDTPAEESVVPAGEKEKVTDDEAVAETQKGKEESNNEPTDDDSKTEEEANTPKTTSQENEQETTDEKQTPASNNEVTLVKERAGRYYLSIASYPSEASAMARRNKLVQQGYADAKVVEAGAGKFRVSLADFANRADANKKVADSKGDYDNIWVFKF